MVSQTRSGDDSLRDLDPVMTEATRWFVALHEDAADASLRPQFEAWREADPQHAAAYYRLQRLWGASGHLPSLARPARSIDRRDLMRGVVGAGGALAVYGVTRIALGPHPLADHSTRPGERRTVTLADGSVVELSTASALSAAFDGRRRRVRLVAGEAFFQVRPDPARPFRVETRAGAVTALGTGFGLAVDGGQAVVSVTEHAVQVEAAAAPKRVQAGQSLRFDLHGVGVIEAADANALAWRRGRLVFVSKSLGEVVSALDRWTPGQTVITDAALSARLVTLMIDTKDAAQGVVRLADALPMRVTRLTPLLTVIRPET